MAKCSLCKGPVWRCRTCQCIQCKTCSITPGRCPVCPEPGTSAGIAVVARGISRPLDAIVDEYDVAGGLSVATLAKYRSALGGFVAWCSGARRRALPCDGETFATYVVHLSESGRSMSTINVHVAAIRFAADRMGFDDPSDEARPRRVLKEARNRSAKANSVIKRRALRYSELCAMVHAIANRKRSLVNDRDKALLTLGWFGGFRRSELCALDIGDLEHTGWAEMGVHVRRSKTDQLGAGKVVGVTLWPDGDVCALRAVQRWVGGAGLESGPLFPTLRHRTLSDRRLSESMAHRIVRKWAVRADLAGIKRLGAHSLRRGFATECEFAQVPMLQVSKHLRHSSTRVTEGYVQTAKALGPQNPIRGLARALYP